MSAPASGTPGASSHASGEPLPVRRVAQCAGCGSTRWRRLALAYEFHGRFPAVECRACGLRFLAVQPTAEGLARLYGGAYFERDFRCGRSAVAYHDEATFRAENEGLLAAFERLRTPGRLLELGCAGGWLLKHACERGWSVRGVELSSDAVAQARALGLDVFEGELPQAGFPAGSFDLIYMGDVLEHVPDPRRVLEECARVLAPGGVLYLRGPITTNSIARRMALAAAGAVGHTLVLREPPYHLWEFTPGPLRRLFERCGLRVEAMRQSKIPPGHAHGEKSAPQRAIMATLDAVNVPLTRACNVLGDRIVVVARKP